MNFSNMTYSEICNHFGLDNLFKAKLSEANLRWAILTEADLRGADLRWAILNGADLSEANLRGANLSEANLSEADLSEADLSEANLSRADLSEADLRGADLSEANLSRATGVKWAEVSWFAHGECGRQLLAVLVEGEILFFCGCVSGYTITKLKQYIDNGANEYKSSRIKAMEFCLSCFEAE